MIPISEKWKESIMQKLYALFLTMGLLAYTVGMVAAYMENIDGLMVFLTIIYCSGAIIFLNKWSNNQISINLLIFYLYLTGNGLMFFCTDELFGIFWLFTAPVLVSVFSGKYLGLMSLLLSLAMTVFWGALASLGYLRWDLGTSANPTISWIAILLIFTLTAMALITNMTSLIEAYGEAITIKDLEHEELEIKQQKLIHANKLLEHEIENVVRLEEEKRQSEKRFDSLFDAAQDLYVLHDANGNIVDVNKETINKLGFTKDDLLDNSGRAATLSNIQLTAKQLDKLKDNKALIIEGNIFDYEGKPLPVEFNNKNIQLNGQTYTLSIIRDISHRRQSEKEIEKINKELQVKVLERTAQFDDAMQELRLEIKNRLNTENELRKTKKILEKNLQEEKKLSEMKTRFVSMISHEYRTPLTIIYTCTDILDFVFQKQDKEMFDKNITRIKRSVNAMINLLEDVLVIGRSEVKEIETESVAFDLKELINDTLEELSITDNYEHQLVTDMPEHPISVYSDMKLVQYIIRNLITNAQKYSPVGSQIDINVVRVDDQYEISVMDKGIGIPENEIGMLFEPFYRSSNVDARSGTGLGLAICKQYADAIGGSISVKSLIDKGSMFTLTLPA